MSWWWHDTFTGTGSTFTFLLLDNSAVGKLLLENKGILLGVRRYFMGGEIYLIDCALRDESLGILTVY